MLNSVVHCFPCIGEIYNSYADDVRLLMLLVRIVCAGFAVGKDSFPGPIWRGTMKLKVKRREMISRIYYLDDLD